MAKGDQHLSRTLVETTASERVQRTKQTKRNNSLKSSVRTLKAKQRQSMNKRPCNNLYTRLYRYWLLILFAIVVVSFWYCYCYKSILFCFLLIFFLYVCMHKILLKYIIQKNLYIFLFHI